MWGEKRKWPGMIPFLLILGVVLATTIFVGQVLGRYYLATLQGEASVVVEKVGISSRGGAFDANRASSPVEQKERQLSQIPMEQVTSGRSPMGQDQVPQSQRAESQQQIPQSRALSAEQSKKKKVLRLNQEKYYTIVMAQNESWDEAFDLGQRLGQQGLPVIVTAEVPHRVLLGFVNNEEKIAVLAERIKIEGQSVAVNCETLNKVAYKFDTDDLFATQTVVPFLGKISVCLSKGLLLYKNITVADEEMIALRPKFAALAEALKQAVVPEEMTAQKETMQHLAELCRKWGQSLETLHKEWGDAQLLGSQQQALVLLEEYHRFLRTTN